MPQWLGLGGSSLERRLLSLLVQIVVLERRFRYKARRERRALRPVVWSAPDEGLLDYSENTAIAHNKRQVFPLGGLAMVAIGG